MRAHLLRAGVAIVAIYLATPAPASAQIYSWRDASGVLVVSNKPRDGATRTYVVANSQGFRSTREAGTARSQPYEQLISTHATAHGVSTDLVRAVIQAESAFNPTALSIKGAMGLMQLMPATAAEYGVTNAYDPAENIRAGVAYLKSLLTRYSNNAELALAAYNAGPTAVEKYGAVPPYRETRNYVDRIRKNAGPFTPPVMKVYRTVEMVNGREVVRYSTTRTEGAILVEPTGR
jgi:soluble lytic murein transglycosylase-like protein